MPFYFPRFQLHHRKRAVHLNQSNSDALQKLFIVAQAAGVRLMQKGHRRTVLQGMFDNLPGLFGGNKGVSIVRQQDDRLKFVQIASNPEQPAFCVLLPVRNLKHRFIADLVSSDNFSHKISFSGKLPAALFPGFCRPILLT